MRLLFLFFAVFLFTGISAQHLPSNIKLKPATPVAGSTVKIKYQPKGMEVNENDELIIKSIRFNLKGEANMEDFSLTKKGKAYEAVMEIPDSTDLLSFIITAGEKNDNNEGNGYLVPVKLNKNAPIPNAYLSKASYYNIYGSYIFEISAQPELGLEMAKKAYEENPASPQAITAYVNGFYTAKGKNGEDELKKLMADIENAGNMDESNYSMFMSFYSRLKETEKANSLKEKRNKKFPDGNWVVNETMQKLNNLEDDTQKENEILKLLKEDKFSNYTARLNTMLLELYHETGENEKLEKLVSTASVKDLHGAYNNIAWAMAEEGENMAVAKKLSEAATNWAKDAVQNTTDKKPIYYSTTDWERQRKYQYSMYADTYAFILYKSGDYSKGLEYAKDAVEIREYKDLEYNDRYALLLEKNATPAEVKKTLEKIAAKGSAGPATQEALKKAFLAENNSEAEYAKYNSGLQQQAKAYLRNELSKKLINEPAESFSLVNLKGEKVNLQDYQGKTVILDFWATWCGPCIASFPGMQKAVDKYKSDDKVAFLFIDTWENDSDREEKVKAFIEKNNYSFNVLFDTPKQDNPDEFDVVSRYKVQGIPTKFVVDKNGRVRFKSIGYSGSIDGLVAELDAMIDLVK